MAPKKEPKAAATPEPDYDHNDPLVQKIKFSFELEVILKPIPQDPPASPLSGTAAPSAEESPQAQEDAAAEPAEAGQGEGEAAEELPPSFSATSMTLSYHLPGWDEPCTTTEPRTNAAAEADGPRKDRIVYAVSHVLVVDESIARMWAERHGIVDVTLGVEQERPPPADGASADGEDSGPFTGEGTFLANLSGLLVGDSTSSVAWPDMTGCNSVPRDLEPVVESAAVRVRLETVPREPQTPEPPAEGEEPVEPPPPTPAHAVPLLTPQLCARLCPMVITPVAAKRMPDQPATMALLSDKCYPPHVRWTVPGAPEPTSREGESTAWTLPPPSEIPVDECGTRTVTFGQPEIILVGDVDVPRFMEACFETPLEFEVHDRTALPEEPKFPMPDDDPQLYKPPPEPEEEAPKKGRKGSSRASRGKSPPKSGRKGSAKGKPGSAKAKKGKAPAEPEEEKPPEPQGPPPPPPWDSFPEYVCAMATVRLTDLVRELPAAELEIDVDLRPKTTIRGAAGLEWKTRPGRYMHAESTFTANLRLGSTLRNAAVAQKQKTLKPYGRAVFIMDYEDSDLFHVLEDSVRAQNALTLKLLPSFGGLEDEDSDLRGTPTKLQAPADPAVQRALKEGAAHAAEAAPDEIRARSASGRLKPVDKKVARFACDEELEEEESDEDDVPLPEFVTLPDGDEITMQVIQSISTVALTPEQVSDPKLDILTGFHFVDGKQRMIVLEGLMEGAMTKVIEQIGQWAQEDPVPFEGASRRKFIWNNHIRAKHRLYGKFGVNFWIIKVRARVSKLVSQPGSFTTGVVRPDCIEGLKRIHGLLSHTMWARQAEATAMFPTAQMMHVVDKKFGGELSKGDVLGIEAEDEEIDMDEGDALGAFEVRSSKSSATGSRRSAASRRSGSRRSRSKKKRGSGVKVPLDTDNELFVIRRREAAAMRALRDFTAENAAALGALETRHAHKRAAWRAWNPQREAQEALIASIAAGELTLLDTERERRTPQIEPVPGTLGRGEALELGWYPHEAPFLWPAPTQPEDYITHPKKPTAIRCEQLRERWVEGELFQPVGLRVQPKGAPRLETIFPPPQLLGKDPEYWKTVHLTGDAGDAQAKADLEAEKKAWADKVVVDNVVFNSTCKIRGAKAAQSDRVRGILDGPPQKLSMKIAAKAPGTVPPPQSMYLAEPHVEADPMGPFKRKPEPEKFTHKESKDFARAIAKDKSRMYKRTMNQSWNASLRDRHD